jgi:hypothetical protein
MAYRTPAYNHLHDFDMITRFYADNSAPVSSGSSEGLMLFIPASASGLLFFFGDVVQAFFDGRKFGRQVKYDGFLLSKQKS